jgi:hypothetical protein
VINLNSHNKSKLLVSGLTSTLLLCLALAPAALASPSVNEYSVPTSNSYPYSIANGSDGDLWFTEVNGNNIGKITPNGNITEYPIPTANSEPTSITTGPDGNLWFTEADGNKIGQLVIAPPKPELINQTVSLAANTGITVNLVDGVSGVSTSSLSILSEPSHGTATDPPGSLTYTPNIGYTGTDSLVYQLCSSTDSLVCSQATLTFDVKASTTTNTTSKVKAPDTGFGAYRSNGLSSVVIYSFASTGLFTLTLGIRKLTKTIHT